LMGRVVNLEAMEEQEKLNKVKMARNHVKSTRLDGGPNARVTKMRITRRGRRR
jgi:expansin (peptidoglycan-binding protein)